jgi:hypothetical protein
MIFKSTAASTDFKRNPGIGLPNFELIVVQKSD